MTYIKQIEPADAEGELKELYAEIMETRGGRVSPVMKSFSLNPAVMRRIKDLNSVITFGGSTLGRRREEMIATLISKLNSCHY